MLLIPGETLEKVMSDINWGATRFSNLTVSVQPSSVCTIEQIATEVFEQDSG